jgi:hypothetical protein
MTISWRYEKEKKDFPILNFASLAKKLGWKNNNKIKRHKSLEPQTENLQFVNKCVCIMSRIFVLTLIIIIEGRER